MNWLEEAFLSLELTPPCEDYLLKRGVKRSSFEKMGEKTWSPLKKNSPDPFFCRRYGSKGLKLTDSLVCPLYSPKGEIIGFESRSIRSKYISRYLLPKANWHPIWVAHKDSAEKIWLGGEVWLVEGRFDLYTMEWIVPVADVVLGSLTASLTPYHFSYLKRLSPPTVYIVYDRDETGKKGSLYVKRELDKLGISNRIINFSGGKDPNEVWEKGGLTALKNSFKYQIGGLLWQ